MKSNLFPMSADQEITGKKNLTFFFFFASYIILCECLSIGHMDMRYTDQNIETTL